MKVEARKVYKNREELEKLFSKKLNKNILIKEVSFKYLFHLIMII
jgi:hypothetical protein